MRKVKFRAWDKLNEKMISHNELFKLDCSNEYPFLALLKNYYQEDLDVKIMQYTGFNDMGGKEIYEGDIIKGLGGFYIVRFGIDPNIGNVCFYLENMQKDNFTYNLTSRPGVKVIGNVHENPEQLGGNDNG